MKPTWLEAQRRLYSSSRLRCQPARGSRMPLRRGRLATLAKGAARLFYPPPGPLNHHVATWPRRSPSLPSACSTWPSTVRTPQCSSAAISLLGAAHGHQLDHLQLPPGEPVVQLPDGGLDHAPRERESLCCPQRLSRGQLRTGSSPRELRLSRLADVLAVVESHPGLAAQAPQRATHRARQRAPRRAPAGWRHPFPRRAPYSKNHLVSRAPAPPPPT